MSTFQHISIIGYLHVDMAADGNEGWKDGWINNAKTISLILWWEMIVLGFYDTSTLVGHLCYLPLRKREEIEKTVQEMTVRDSEERRTGMKVKKYRK